MHKLYKTYSCSIQPPFDQPSITGSIAIGFASRHKSVVMWCDCPNVHDFINPLRCHFLSQPHDITTPRVCDIRGAFKLCATAIIPSHCSSKNGERSEPEIDDSKNPENLVTLPPIWNTNGSRPQSQVEQPSDSTRHRHWPTNYIVPWQSE